MSDLRERLMDIRGVGESTADEILSVLEETDTDTSENVEQAYDYLQAGRPGYAEKYLRREVE